MVSEQNEKTKQKNKKPKLTIKKKYTYRSQRDPGSSSPRTETLLPLWIHCWFMFTLSTRTPRTGVLQPGKKMHFIWHKVEDVFFPFYDAFLTWLSCVHTPSWEPLVKTLSNESIRNSNQKVTKKTPKQT